MPDLVTADPTAPPTGLLINGLGGDADFGEQHLVRGDDSGSVQIELAPIFGSSGLNFFGATYSSLWINPNGNVTFGRAVDTYTPDVISGGVGTPIIAPFWADVDTRPTVILAPTPGGVSTGSNLVWYDQDVAGGILTVTWDDVGVFPNRTDQLNAFQLRIIGQGDGDFDFEFRYEAINWTVGSDSGARHGRAGYASSTASDPGNVTYELPQSGLEADLLALETTIGNAGLPGLWSFEVRNGTVVQQPVVSLDGGGPVLDEGATGGTTSFAFALSRAGDLGAAQSVGWAVTGSGAHPADAADFADGALPSGIASFASGAASTTVTVSVSGDGTVEFDEGFTLTLREPSDGLEIGVASADGTIRNDDRSVATLAARAASVDEGGPGADGVVLFDVTLDQAPVVDQSIGWRVESSSVAGADAGDLLAGTAGFPAGTLGFVAGATTGTIAVDVLGDLLVEPTEALALVLETSSSGIALAAPGAAAAIVDDDSAHGTALFLAGLGAGGGDFGLDWFI
jgi:hypothetical protein